MRRPTRPTTSSRVRRWSPFEYLQPLVACCRKSRRYATIGCAMEYGTITKHIHIDASPEVVYEVITSPEHIAQWWGVEVDVDPAPGATGVFTWNRKANAPPTTVNV